MQQAAISLFCLVAGLNVLVIWRLMKNISIEEALVTNLLLLLVLAFLLVGFLVVAVGLFFYILGVNLVWGWVIFIVFLWLAWLLANQIM